MRSKRLRKKFHSLFGHAPEVEVVSPGRAEIIGNHTDYNLGLALGCAISQSTLGLFRARPDDTLVIHSTSSDFVPHSISFSLKDLQRDPTVQWGNYARGVAMELLALKYPLTGADILIDTNFPTSGGLSSSAALELCIAYGLLALIGVTAKPEVVAAACQRAENGPLVNSPCGFLDQGVIAFAKPNQMVLLDFSPPVKINLIPADLKSHGVSLVVAVDRTVKRELGTSGFPQRRKMCEEACALLNIGSLSELTPETLRKYRDQLPTLIADRVEHVVLENERVRLTVSALKKNDMAMLGTLFNQSGKSALDLFGLDEKTPELRVLMESAQETDGVLGARNMGGGFSATILALVQTAALADFRKSLQRSYQKHFPGTLEYIEFTPGSGVSATSIPNTRSQ